ncbi:MAG: helix-turn-helix domain-containing protein, partial [Alphaproteobacteria bacterium]|nr:helix-turn-helix domain-containing protein [Alphaproteobacteria bacterium]
MEKEKNIDIEKEVETVGEILRNARLKSGKTISDVADDLCIRKVYLTAIEEMDFNHIPEMPYGLGFIRSYAHYLGLNSDRIVTSYKQVESAKNSNKFDDADDAVVASKPSFRHILIGIIGLAILVAAWLFISVRREQEPVFETDKVAVVAEPEIIDDVNEKDEVAAEEEVSEEDAEDQDK